MYLGLWTSKCEEPPVSSGYQRVSLDGIGFVPLPAQHPGDEPMLINQSPVQFPTATAGWGEICFAVVFDDEKTIKPRQVIELGTSSGVYAGMGTSFATKDLRMKEPV